MLFLTGDQIYADDVADSVLHHILSLADQLVGTETLPGIQDPSKTLASGRRAKLVSNQGGLSSSESKSHLIRFSEYAVMYLMTWSPSP